MKLIIRKTFIASSMAAVLAVPAFAAVAQTEQDRAGTPQVQAGHNQSTTAVKPSADGRIVAPTERTTTGSSTMNAADNKRKADAAMPKTKRGEAYTTAPDLKSYVYTQSADDLEGTKIVDRDGKDVGKIKSVLVSQDHHSAFAVVAVGGVMGMGAREVLVPFADLQREGNDNLKMAANRAEISRIADYESEPYVELKGKEPISESIREAGQSVSSVKVPSAE